MRSYTENEMGAIADAVVVLDYFYQSSPTARPTLGDPLVQKLIDDISETGPSDRLAIESNIVMLIEKMHERHQ